MAEPTEIKRILDEKTEKLKNNQPSEDVGNLSIDGMVVKKKNGGARPGAGRPKGKLSKKNMTAQEAKNRFIERVHQHADELFNAQLNLAIGETVAMVKVKERDSKGKVIKTYHELVRDPDTIAMLLDNEFGDSTAEYHELNDEDHFYYIKTQPANNQALEGMLNRAFGKAPEKIEIEGGFFKADSLTINIVEPRKDLEEDGNKHEDVIDVVDVTETEAGAQSS